MNGIPPPRHMQGVGRDREHQDRICAPLPAT